MLTRPRPRLREAFCAYLRGANATDHLTRKQAIDSERAARWLDQALKRLQRVRLLPSLAELKHQVGGHASKSAAILLAVLLDGLPEALVVAARVLTVGTVSVALLGSIFASNFPKALSSAAGMREHSFPTTLILLIWIGLKLMTGAVAGIGALTMEYASASVYILIEGFAAGAMLTIVTKTMLPEAYQRGGGIVGLSTLPGFLSAVLL